MKYETQRKSHLCIVLFVVAEVVQVVLDAILVITIVDMTVDTTEAATIAMTTGTTTDHTGAYHNLFSETLQIIIGEVFWFSVQFFFNTL